MYKSKRQAGAWWALAETMKHARAGVDKRTGGFVGPRNRTSCMNMRGVCGWVVSSWKILRVASSIRKQSKNDSVGSYRVRSLVSEAFVSFEAGGSSQSRIQTNHSSVRSGVFVYPLWYRYWVRSQSSPRERVRVLISRHCRPHHHCGSIQSYFGFNHDSSLLVFEQS